MAASDDWIIVFAFYPSIFLPFEYSLALASCQVFPQVIVHMSVRKSYS